MTESTIAIIGATSGVAQSLCKQLAGEGIHFILVARDAEKLERVASDLIARGAKAETVVQNLAALDELDSVLTRIKSAEHLFLFHSELTDQELAERDWEVARSSLTLNLNSPLFFLHGFASILEERAQGGSIVVVTSVAGDRGRASNYWYGTAKGALAIHCQGLRNRLSKNGVQVLTVKPGFIDTPMTAHLPKKPAILWASAEQVSALIVRAWRKKKSVVYTPGFWRYIMWVIVAIPESIFKRLSL